MEKEERRTAIVTIKEFIPTARLVIENTLYEVDGEEFGFRTIYGSGVGSATSKKEVPPQLIKDLVKAYVLSFDQGFVGGLIRAKDDEEIVGCAIGDSGSSIIMYFDKDKIEGLPEILEDINNGKIPDTSKFNVIGKFMVFASGRSLGFWKLSPKNAINYAKDELDLRSEWLLQHKETGKIYFCNHDDISPNELIEIDEDELARIVNKNLIAQQAIIMDLLKEDVLLDYVIGGKLGDAFTLNWAVTGEFEKENMEDITLCGEIYLDIEVPEEVIKVLNELNEKLNEKQEKKPEEVIN